MSVILCNEYKLSCSESCPQIYSHNLSFYPIPDVQQNVINDNSFYLLFSLYCRREFENKKNRSDREKYGFEPDNTNKIDNKIVTNGGSGYTDNSWYKEVIELRKKAGEYKNRGWGVEMNPDLYNKQVELWDQVSRRSSLSALSLASTVR